MISIYRAGMATCSRDVTLLRMYHNSLQGFYGGKKNIERDSEGLI